MRYRVLLALACVACAEPRVPPPKVDVPVAPVAAVASVPKPKPKPANETSFDVAHDYARAHDVTLYRYHEQYEGNAEGFSAPIVRTDDGGFIVVGTKRPEGEYRVGQSRPVVVRLDAHGQVQWEKAFKKPGFLHFEGGSAIPAGDGGYVIYVLCYVHPARASVARLFEIDAHGTIVWDRQLRGDGTANTPHPQTVQRTAKGTYVLAGHIYLSPTGEDAYGWTGEISATGELLRDEVGGLHPYGDTKARLRR